MYAKYAGAFKCSRKCVKTIHKKFKINNNNKYSPSAGDFN